MGEGVVDLAALLVTFAIAGVGVLWERRRDRR